MRWLFACIAVLWAGCVMAQDSAFTDTRRGISAEIYTSTLTPWRLILYDNPKRISIDLQGDMPQVQDQSERITQITRSTPRPGWSRLVAELSGPFAVETAQMAQDGQLTLHLIPVSEAEFLKNVTPGPEMKVVQDDGVLTVVIDPGHGGVDPGAQRGGVDEAALMLTLARELAGAINAYDGMQAVLTRDADVFVPLETRMTIARNASVDVFLSLHADALEADLTSGASVYRLDRAGQDQAAQRMAQWHDAGDLLHGLDLSGQDDSVALALLELARTKTGPASRRLQAALIKGMRAEGARVNQNPERAALLGVLMAADFPSVLIEAGFLSNDTDRAALQSIMGRGRIVAGIVNGLRAWTAAEQRQ